MKKSLLNFIRNKGLLICMFFLFLFAFETFAQYFGTSRRVARRTARRTSRRHNAYYNGGYGGYGAAAPGYVTTLPGGCVLRAITGINYQYCGGVYYRPYYEGTTVVYQVVEEDEVYQD